jgi:hypothetical protein
MTRTGGVSARVEQAKDRATGHWGRHNVEGDGGVQGCVRQPSRNTGRVVERGHLPPALLPPVARRCMRPNGANQHTHIQKKKYIGENARHPDRTSDTRGIVPPS